MTLSYQKGNTVTLSTLLGNDWQGRTATLTLFFFSLAVLYVIGIRVF